MTQRNTRRNLGEHPYSTSAFELPFTRTDHRGERGVSGRPWPSERACRSSNMRPRHASFDRGGPSDMPTDIEMILSDRKSPHTRSEHPPRCGLRFKDEVRIGRGSGGRPWRDGRGRRSRRVRRLGSPGATASARARVARRRSGPPAPDLSPPRNPVRFVLADRGLLRAGDEVSVGYPEEPSRRIVVASALEVHP